VAPAWHQQVVRATHEASVDAVREDVQVDPVVTGWTSRLSPLMPRPRLGSVCVVEQPTVLERDPDVSGRCPPNTSRLRCDGVEVSCRVQETPSQCQMRPRRGCYRRPPPESRWHH